MNDLRDKHVLQFDSEIINAFELAAGDTTYFCRKDTAGGWQMLQPKTGPVRSWKMTGLLSDLASATAEDFASDDPASLRSFGLDQPQIRVRLLQEEKTIAEFLIGKNKDTATLYAKAGGGRTVFLIKNELFDKLNIKSADLLESLPAASAVSPE